MSHIVMRNVRKAYRVGSETVTALNDLSLEIEAGEFAVVLGPSGSGKTTFRTKVTWKSVASRSAASRSSC